jgi:hypothetical protein
MFLETLQHLPLGSRLRIEILFDPEARSSRLPVHAQGVAVHSTREGVGIRFTSIDLSALLQTVVEKMNRVDRQEKAVYTIGPVRAAAAGMHG